MGRIVQLSEANFDSVVSGAAVALVEFWGPWCQPCRAMAPLLRRMADCGDAVVGSVDLSENVALAARFEVMSVPTFMAFREGISVRRHGGVATFEQLVHMVGIAAESTGQSE